MSVEFRNGDLFNQPDLEAIGHGVNLKGAMASGIAAIFRKKFPEMEREYVEMCNVNLLQLGSVFTWISPNDDSPWIFNIATQVNPGSDARLSAVEVGLINAIRECEYQGISSLGIPQIGCGIGGLDWREVKAMIEQVASNTDVKIVVVSL